MPDLVPLLRALPLLIVAGSDLLVRTGFVQIGRHGPAAVDDRVPESVARLERVASDLAVCNAVSLAPVEECRCPDPEPKEANWRQSAEVSLSAFAGSLGCELLRRLALCCRRRRQNGYEVEAAVQGRPRRRGGGLLQ